MPKAETTFRPIEDSDQHMHGTPAVLISGLQPDQLEVIRESLPGWGLSAVPLIVVTAEILPLSLDEATALPDGTNSGLTADLPQAVIMSGLTGRQLNRLMDGYRQSGLPRPLWASVTPHSAAWTVKYLLIELLKEREAMRQAMLDEQKRKPPETPPSA